MIQQKIQEWMKHPEQLDKDTLYELRSVVARYPFFQTARLLLLKNLYLLQDPSFKEELQKSALFVADLSILFYYIEGEHFIIRQHAEGKAETDNTSSDRTLDLIDRFLSDLSVPPSDTLPIPQTEVCVDYASLLLRETDHPKASAEANPLKGQELIDQFIEHSDGTPDGQEPIQAEEIQESSAVEPVETLSRQPAEEEEESYFTETLAKIYVKQQRYDKALEIIKKLNLKYPKKNVYFADQIRFLERLIINAKSK